MALPNHDTHHIHHITTDSELWPHQIESLDDVPTDLFARGDVFLLSTRPDDLITITGARASTSYGNTIAREITHDLCQDGKVIVTGGAYGIDATALRAALDAGSSPIVVLPAGIDRLYPQGNHDLLQRVEKQGLLISSHPTAALPNRQSILKRGRLMAHLANTTVIVEAGPRSGSTNVALEANSHGRAVCAVPGPITSVTSTGCHRLIADGTAVLIQDASDVLHTMKNTTPETAS